MKFIETLDGWVRVSAITAVLPRIKAHDKESPRCIVLTSGGHQFVADGTAYDFIARIEADRFRPVKAQGCIV